MKFLTAIMLACTTPLAGCGVLNAPSAITAPSKALVAANDLYTAGSKAGQALVTLGLLDKEEFKKRDAYAYDVLTKVRSGKATLEQLQVAITLITSD